MDLRTPEAVALNSNKRMDKALVKVDEKAGQLKTMGLTIRDQDLLANRLNFSRARQAYTKIQEASDYLFLAVVLAVSPTECAQKAFDRVLEHFIRLDNYEKYSMGLDASAKRSFESTTAANGFSSALPLLYENLVS
ncbi:hypothetical protein ACJ73_04686 [Blastomyces percursus]|uniref:Uncharacterized protein n=1 Tax=Blastomyces percursus TaxID=1658174 RepID=A0A1J9Q5H4_9EURO|nr:hypothetical protein ACJ73_04686 [Blastomyces percursus]